MDEAPGAAINHTRYNLRRRLARSHRWGTLSIPREQESVGLEQMQREILPHTSRVSRLPHQQRRDISPEVEIIGQFLPSETEVEIIDEVLPSQTEVEIIDLQRSNEQQNSQQISSRGTSVSSITHQSEVTSGNLPQVSGTVSNARQQFSGRIHITNNHGVESAPQNHASAANDSRSHNSEAHMPADQGRVADGVARNRGETSATVQHGNIGSHHRPHHMHGSSETSTNSTRQDMQDDLISLEQYRNLLIVDRLTRNQRHEIKDLPEAVIKEEQVHSGHKCVICLCDFELNEKVNKLPCDHIYHKNCIIPWLQYSNNCPLCRRPVKDNGFHSVSPSQSLITRIQLELILRDGDVSIVERL